MRSFPISHFYRLADGGVQCGEGGLFVGATPMLARSPRAGGGDFLVVRPVDELDRELSASYGLPIDIASKRDGLAGVAGALERGDLALAKIAALLLRFPDPPSLTKEAPARGSWELAERLFASGLLKGNWDPSKHPRLGGPPNRGRFTFRLTEDAPESKPLAPGEPGPEAPATRGVWRKGLKGLRETLKDTAEEVIQSGNFTLWGAPELKIGIEIAILLMETLAPSELNTGEQQEIDQSRASLDPPKTLEELQKPPTQNVLGYERHHIVEQNPANIAKSPIEVVIEKFGRAVIDDPSNIVWVPRLKHELITTYYNSKDASDPNGRLHRGVVNDMDYDSQYAAGLQALQMYGVLQ